MSWYSVSLLRRNYLSTSKWIVYCRKKSNTALTMFIHSQVADNDLLGKLGLRITLTRVERYFIILSPEKMAPFSNVLSWINIIAFCLQFHYIFFSWGSTDDESSLVQLMAWHCLNQCTMSYGATRLQWVKKCHYIPCSLIQNQCLALFA